MRNTERRASCTLEILILVVFSLFLGSCTDFNLDPIFWTLANEETLEDDKGFEDSVTVFRLGKLGSTYYVAANQVYYRPVDSSEVWNIVEPPQTGALSNTLLVFTGEVVAGFYDSLTGVGIGLWKFTDPSDPDPSDPSITPWTKITDTDLVDATDTDKQIVMLQEAGGHLFVATVSADGYSLYYGDTNSVTPLTIGGNTTVATPIVDITSDGTNFWFITGVELYTDTINPPTAFTLAAGAPSVSKHFGGVYWSADHGKLYVSSQDGKLHTFNGGWISSDENTVDSDQIPFWNFLELNPGGGDIFVGTAAFGYYRINAGDITDIERQPYYNISELYN
ncbi:MAG TPA: hypothetical protein ENI27_02355, partial [bacterium]|nr:hypothetical protein [bacterium]